MQGMSISSFFIIFLSFLLFRSRRYMVMVLYAAVVCIEDFLSYDAFAYADIVFLGFLLIKCCLFFIILAVVKKMFSGGKDIFTGIALSLTGLMTINIIIGLVRMPFPLLFMGLSTVFTLIPLMLCVGYITVHRSAYSEMPGTRIAITRNVEKTILIAAMCILAFALNMSIAARIFSVSEVWSHILSSFSIILFVVAAVSHMDAWKTSSDTAALQRMAYWDDLTSVMNRRASIIYLERHLHYEERSMMLLFLDIKDFKQVNDEYGHKQGDAVLRKIGIELSSALAQGEYVFRVGGDEFLILLNDAEEQRHRDAFLKRLDDMLVQSVMVKNTELLVHVNAGIALFPKDGRTREALIEKADLALSTAKQHSKAYAFYDEESADSNA